MKKRIIAFSLLTIMLISLVPVSAFAAAQPKLKLPPEYLDISPDVGTNMPFKPRHQYLYRQNPPVFSWPKLNDAESYDLIICADEKLTDVCFMFEDIKDNFYLMREPLETNKYYWWALRYNKGDDFSEWSVARRFKVASDSKVVIIPTAEELLPVFAESGHPRLYVSQATLPGLKEKIKTSDTVAKYLNEVMIPTAEKAIEKGIEPEPQVLSQAEKDALNYDDAVSYSNNGRYAQQRWGNAAMNAALTYLLTDDTKYADFAVDSILQFADWNWRDENSSTSIKGHDLGFYEGLLYLSLTYDWMYNYMTPDERTKVGDSIRDRVLSYIMRQVNGLVTSPYSSHEWSYTPFGGVALAVLLGDYPEVSDEFTEWAGIYLSNFMPLSIEDGGYGKGMNYWASAFPRDSVFVNALTLSGLCNFYDIPYNSNQYLWPIYMYATPNSILSSWGDGGNIKPTKEWMVPGASQVAVLSDRPELIWWRNKLSKGWQYPYFDSIFFIETDDWDVEAPVYLPRDWCFIDQGMTAMHSDLVAGPRTTATFRSGLYGSYNHAHADINGFMIEKYGTPLAFKSGYYDGTNTTHYANFFCRTHAHNSITFDNGKGQGNDLDNFDADGKTTMFLSNTDMAVAVGDGTDAYMGELGKFERTFIYVRPDSFLVIDNLKASEKAIERKGGSTFEWWLNSIGTLDIHDDNRGIAITNGDVALDARIHYPQAVTPYYSNVFSGPDLVSWELGPLIKVWDYHKRAWFQTEVVPETKMVVTMGTKEITEASEYVKCDTYDNYMELEFEDGTLAFVSTLTDETQTIDTGEYKFNGTALVCNTDHLMFIGGTELWIRGEKVIEADRPVAVSIGFDELSVSSGDDYNIKIYPNDIYIPTVDSIRFRNSEEEIGMGMGIETNVDEEGVLNIHADKGHYSFLLNDKPLPGGKAEGTWTYTIELDGVEEVHTIDNLYYNHNGDIVAEGLTQSSMLAPDTEYFVLSKTGGISYNDDPAILGTNTFWPGDDFPIFIKDNNSKVVLQSIASSELTVEKMQDQKSVIDAAAVIVEAENCVAKEGETRETKGIETRGLAKVNNPEDKAFFKIEIKEAGMYDFLIRYACSMDIRRYFELNSIRYYMNVPAAAGYGANDSHFEVLRADSNLYLEPGIYELIISGNATGNWNFDWIGFIKE